MYDPRDYDGESFARDESDRREAAERREDERDEEKAREAICLAEAPEKYSKTQVIALAAAQGIALDPAASHIPLPALEALGLDREWSKYVRIARRANAMKEAA